MFPKKKKKRSPSKRVWLPKTWFGHTQQSPVPGNTGGQKNDTFGGHIGKEPRLMNHTYTYSKQSRKSKNATHSHMYGIYKRKKREEGKIAETRRKYEKVIA